MRALFFTLNTLLLCLLTSAVLAQGENVPIKKLGTVTNDGDIYPRLYNLCLDENGQIAVKVNVLLGNLQINGTYPDEYGIIPPNAPNMSVEFTINGMTNIVPVGNFDPVILESGYPAFSYIAESDPFDFSDGCVDNEDGFVAVVVSYRLVTQEEDDGPWVTYPACDFKHTMFSCNVYSYAPWCEDMVIYQQYSAPDGPDNPTCYDSWFSGSYPARLLCDCGSDDPLPGPDKGVEEVGHFSSGGATSNRFVLENKINAFPNPVRELLNIESIGESIRKIEIYNSRGAIIKNYTFDSDENHNTTINTSELPSGLYLVRVSTDSGIEVVKVLK